ncbi:hypothetical protein [Acetonema longum]|uniref:Uncharacterized protein n=1 Tax=Acetonema longum DSM 6540 TaxID=1009370 RepID=F7NKC4_9FIRM|nr:hypothetical protein [Acetonema longum]EGO63565.1 hypothetical protein ALO_12686 [Acetonema longum DSM 6540]
MKRFWASWYSGNYVDEGCTKPPFKIWISEYEEYEIVLRDDNSGREDCTIYAVIDIENEEMLWALVEEHYPDFRERFCIEKPLDWNPGERFR